MTASPSTPEYRALDTQVGGHPGVLSSEDGSLIIKPCLPTELAIYEQLAQGEPRLARLQPFVPKFFGTLKLQGKVKEEAGLSEAEGAAILHQELNPPPDHQDKVLENISFYFEKPNVMDIKLGTVLYDESASPEKKQRMIDTARETTSLETGVRLTGCEVYDHSTGAPVVTPKSYGKNIKPVDLPDGIRRFFPLAANAEEPEGQGLPQSLLLPVLAGILDELRAIREAFAETEVRMVGGSLLICYEAIWEKVKEGLHRQRQKALQSRSKEETDGVDDADDEEEDSDDEEQALAYAVRLIDLAHTKVVPGEGPDQGVLKGIDSTISLLEGRLKEVETGKL